MYTYIQIRDQQWVFKTLNRFKSYSLCLILMYILKFYYIIKSIQNVEWIQIILIISDTNVHSNLFSYHRTSTHIQRLQYSFHSYFKIRMILLISTLHNIYSRRRKWVWFEYVHYNTQQKVVCLLCLLSLSFSFFFFINATTTKTVNFDEWCETLESFMSIIRILWI